MFLLLALEANMIRLIAPYAGSSACLASGLVFSGCVLAGLAMTALLSSGAGSPHGEFGLLRQLIFLVLLLGFALVHPATTPASLTPYGSGGAFLVKLLIATSGLQTFLLTVTAALVRGWDREASSRLRLLLIAAGGIGAGITSTLAASTISPELELLLWRIGFTVFAGISTVLAALLYRWSKAGMGDF